jgi:hypothetical protein
MRELREETMTKERLKRGRSQAARKMTGILFLFSLLAAGASLRAQNSSTGLPDPFEDQQRRLDTAADDQLALVKGTRWLGTFSVAGSIESTRSTDAELSGGSLGLSMVKRTDFAEGHGESLGMDAQRILTEEGLPVELLGVAKVESNFNRFAVSRKGAAGLWQFMPQTARRYGLRVDALEDERFDVEKSTRAAGRYLRDLYLQFGDWPLALAAYNAGGDAVQRAIDHTSDHNFTSINRVGLLPAETRAYVPAVLKAAGSLRSKRSAPKCSVGMN